MLWGNRRAYARVTLRGLFFALKNPFLRCPRDTTSYQITGNCPFERQQCSLQKNHSIVTGSFVHSDRFPVALYGRGRKSIVASVLRWEKGNDILRDVDIKHGISFLYIQP